MIALLLSVLALALGLIAGVYAALRLRPAINALRAKVDETSSRIDETAGWRNDERRLSRELEKTQINFRKVEIAFTKLTAEVGKLTVEAGQDALKQAKLHDTFSVRLAEMSSQLANLAKTVSTVENRSAHNPSVNASMALTHRRLVSPDAITDFKNTLAPKFGLEFSERQLYHLAHRVCVIEELCHGRLATSVDAILTRLSAALFLTRDANRKFHCAEIGTLYGIGAIAIYDAVRFNLDDVHFTIIDPLDGYYEANAKDYVSAKPVTRRVFEANWRIAGGSMDDLSIIQALSESSDALSAVADGSLDMLIIDGDHSYEGVKRDFVNYFPKVRTGGVIVVDDYDVPEWPSIKKYSDEELRQRTDLQWMFAGNRTLLLRKI